MRITSLVTALALAACAHQSSQTNETTSMTTTTGVAVESGPASPGDPSGLTPEFTGVTATAGSSASPMEGECPRGDPSLSAADLATCVRSCRGQNDQVPLGSHCMSRYASCTSQCHDRFPTP